MTLFLQILKNPLRHYKLFLTFFMLMMTIVMAGSIYLYQNIIYTIHSGEAGVKYLRFGGGTVIDRVYGEGFYLIFPWNKMYIYNVRIQEVPHEFDVLSQKGLKVHLKISIRCYPEYDLLSVLHQKVGPNYIEKVVIPEIESVLRIIIGKIDAEDIYTTKSSLIEEAINDAIEQVSQRFVRVDDVIIKLLELPMSVQKTIRYKIEQKHLAEAYVYKIQRETMEAERKRIEAGGLHDYNNILDASLTPKVLRWKGIQATLKLAQSNNAKVVVIGSSTDGLPIIGNIPFLPKTEDEAIQE